MGIQKTVTLTYTCDKCGDEIHPSEVFTGINKTFGYYMDGTKDYQINVELQIPCQEKTVVCKDCALEILKQGIKTLEGDAV